MKSFLSFFKRILAWFNRAKTSITPAEISDPRVKTPVPASLRVVDATPKKEVIRTNITLDWTTLFRLMLAVGVFWVLMTFVLQLQSILITLAIVMFLALGLSPILTAMERWMPRAIAILVLYVIFLGIIVLMFSTMLPIVAEQIFQIALKTRDAAANADLAQYEIVNQVLELLNIQAGEIETIIADNLTAISTQLRNIVGGGLSVASGIFSGVLSFLFSLVLLFFVLLEREQIGQFFLLLIPRKDRTFMIRKAKEIQFKMAHWFEAQLLLMVSIAVLMFIGLSIISLFFPIPHILTISLFAGFMELFPYIGVLLTGFFSAIIALNISWIAAIVVVSWMLFAQALEGNVLIPVIMERVIGLSGLVTLISMTVAAVIGNALGGIPLAIICIILSVPIATTVKIFIREYVEREQHHMDNR